jgi:uncharacterized membrane protein YfcA
VGDGASEAFLGMAGIDLFTFSWLSGLALVTAFIAGVAGTAGGMILIAGMAFVFPPSLLIPLHTVVQLGAAVSMAASRWRWLMRETVLPFVVGAAVGAAIGGRIFVSLPENVLLVLLALSMLILTWIPGLARFGPEKGRFLFVGFLVTFLGVFISATGSMLAAFTVAAAPDRRNHIATLGSLMVVVHVAKLVTFVLIGVQFGSYAPLMAAMIAASFAGTWLARPVLDRIPERTFRLAFQIILTLLGLRLLAKAAGY